MDMADILDAVHNLRFKKHPQHFREWNCFHLEGERGEGKHAGGHFLNRHVEKLYQKSQT
jgi:hypothetical protein